MEKNESQATQKEAGKQIVMLEHDLYVIADANGKAQWYHKDPLKINNRNNAQFDLGELIFDQMDGPGDLVNPIMVRLMLYRKRRGDGFSPDLLEKMRRKEVDAHLEDMEGNVVEMTQRLSVNAVYPLNAVIYNADGSIKETRAYSTSGFCADGVDSHRVVVIKGQVTQ